MPQESTYTLVRLRVTHTLNWLLHLLLVPNMSFTFRLTEKRPELRGGYMLCFLDDGIGMDQSKCYYRYFISDYTLLKVLFTGQLWSVWMVLFIPRVTRDAQLFPCVRWGHPCDPVRKVQQKVPGVHSDRTVWKRTEIVRSRHASYACDIVRSVQRCWSHFTCYTVFLQGLHAYWQRLHPVHQEREHAHLPFLVPDVSRGGGAGWGQSLVSVVIISDWYQLFESYLRSIVTLISHWSKWNTQSLIHVILLLILPLQVIVPLPSWNANTQEPLASDPEKYAIETELIFKYSPFKDKQQLMEQFNKIQTSSGELSKLFSLTRVTLKWSWQGNLSLSPFFLVVFCQKALSSSSIIWSWWTTENQSWMWRQITRT